VIQTVKSPITVDILLPEPIVLQWCWAFYF